MHFEHLIKIINDGICTSVLSIRSIAALATASLAVFNYSNAQFTVCTLYHTCIHTQFSMLGTQVSYSFWVFVLFRWGVLGLCFVSSLPLQLTYMNVASVLNTHD